MQFALLVYESPEALSHGTNDETIPHRAWRAYYKALVEAGIYSAAIHLKCRRQDYGGGLKEGSDAYRRPLADHKEHWGIHNPGTPSLTQRSIGPRAGPAASAGAWRFSPCT